MHNLEQFKRAIKEAEIAFTQEEPLKNHTSFKIGGAACVFCKPQSTEQLQLVLAVAQKYKIPCYLLGKGTNVLFGDEGHSGVIVHIGEAFASVTVKGETITAGAGASLKDVCVLAQQNGLAGMEFAYGIPGSVGGAVYMNAGAYTGEMCDIVEQVAYLTQEGTIEIAGLEKLELGYRTSVFQKQPWCILSATFRLENGDKNEINALMEKYMSSREEKQPLDMPSAGSAFKRPPGAFAGALIDQSGLRGFQLGGAAISQKHCGFIVNVGEATCADVLELAEEVSRIVKEKTGYELEKEIRVVDAGAGLYPL